MSLSFSLSGTPEN